MILKFSDFINESRISNFEDNLRQIAVEKFEKSFPRIAKSGYKGSFHFEFEKYKGDEEGREFYNNERHICKVKVVFENRRGKSGGYIKKQFDNYYIVFINTEYTENKDYDVNFRDLLETYVHEITHISQYISGFLEWDIDDKRDKYLHRLAQRTNAKSWSNNSYQKYKRAYNYGSEHEARESEHEAVLSSFAEMMKRGDVDYAVDRYLLSDNKKYFNFTFKKFVSKLYTYGVSKENIEKARSIVKEYLENKINELTENRINSVSNLSPFIYGNYIIIQTLGFNDYFKKLIWDKKSIVDKEEYVDYYTSKYDSMDEERAGREYDKRYLKSVENFKNNYNKYFL